MQLNTSEAKNRLSQLIKAVRGDLPYVEKPEHYAGQNLLTRSLHELAYDHNPGFSRFIANGGLPFRPYAEFHKSDLDARQTLYQKLAEQIWSPDRLAQAAIS